MDKNEEDYVLREVASFAACMLVWKTQNMIQQNKESTYIFTLL